MKKRSWVPYTISMVFKNDRGFQENIYSSITRKIRKMKQENKNKHENEKINVTEKINIKGKRKRNM